MSTADFRTGDDQVKVKLRDGRSGWLMLVIVGLPYPAKPDRLILPVGGDDAGALLFELNR